MEIYAWTVVGSIIQLLRLGALGTGTLYTHKNITGNISNMSNIHCQKKRGGRGSRNVVALLRSVSLFFTRGPAGPGMKDSAGKLPRDYKKHLHFTKQEMEALNLIYDRLVGDASGPSDSGRQSPQASARAQKKDGIERLVFRDLLHSTFSVSGEDILMDRMFSAFDVGSDGLIGRDEWIVGASVFLKGTLEERAAFTFAVYDLNSDGFIVREEIYTLLRNSLVKQPQDEDPEEGVKDLVELVLRKLDHDKDGKISFADFRESVLQEPLFLEAFGQCLPTEQAAAAFLATLSAGPNPSQLPIIAF